MGLRPGQDEMMGYVPPAPFKRNRKAVVDDLYILRETALWPKVKKAYTTAIAHLEGMKDVDFNRRCKNEGFTDLEGIGFKFDLKIKQLRNGTCGEMKGFE